MAILPLHTADIRQTFSQEVTALGGTVTEVFEEGPLLWARSVLPWVEEVRRSDKVQGGIALRSTGHEVFVHPYTFRFVCTNGCIIASALQTRQIAVSDYLPDEDATEAIREAVRASGDREVFAEVARQMRTAQEAQADMTISLMATLRRMPGDLATRFLGQIAGRFIKDGDRSRFGLVNAVTSVARDTADPNHRWRLEEFGGSLLVALPDAPEFDDSAVESFATA